MHHLISPTLKSKNIYRNALIKCQIFVPNLNMPKLKWEGTEDPIINNFFKIESRQF